MKKITKDSFIEYVNKKHNHKYDYSLVDWKGTQSTITIICPKHGEFKQKASQHKLYGCQKCAYEEYSQKRLNDNFNKKIDKANQKHNHKYDYSKIPKNANIKDKVIIICPDHGEFEQRFDAHINGQGCSKCNGGVILTKNDFIDVAKRIHNNKYDYSKVNYKRAHDHVEIICPDHGVFLQTPTVHVSGRGCHKCGKIISQAENELANYIENELKISIIKSDRNIIKPYEIDILIPDFKIGIEYCGLYYHSNIFKDKNDHKKKLKLMNQKGYNLITIFEDEWVNKNDIVKNKLKQKLNKNNKKRIYARNCSLKEVTDQEYKNFNNRYHIQGAGVSVKYRYGLYYNSDLVACIGMKYHKNKDTWEIIRYVTSVNVVGGFSKLLKNFIKLHKTKKILSFADLRYTYIENNVYKKNGFKLVEVTKPNYFYFKSGENIRYSRIKFQKHKLKDLLVEYNSSFSEKDNMINNNYHYIYDCGNLKYELNIK